MMENKVPARATAKHARSKTLVWWDMDNCPLPNGYEPSRLAPRIDTELKNLGYSGPLTIFALGNLEGISHDFLRALFSTGVNIKHVPNDRTSVFMDFLEWDDDEDEPPKTVMVISDSLIMPAIIDSLSYFKDGKYNLLLARPLNNHDEPLKHPRSGLVSGEWLWTRDSLLKDSGFLEETRGLEKVIKPLGCRLCQFGCLAFDDFISHLDSSKHKEKIEYDNQSKLLQAKLNAEDRANAIKAHKKEKALEAQALQAQRKMTKRLSKACFSLKFQSIPKKRTKRRRSKAKKLETGQVEASSSLAVKEQSKASVLYAKTLKGENLEIEGECAAHHGD